MDTPNPLPPPFVSVDGIANFRDLSGHPTTLTSTHGQPITPGLAFRCADPSKVSEEGLRTMSEVLGIKTIFDLRSLPEINRDSPFPPNDLSAASRSLDARFAAHSITRRWVPVFAAEDYGPEQIALRYKAYTRRGTEGFVAAYRDILQHGGPAFGDILRYLSSSSEEEQPGACVFHCTAGKDRTGLLAALLLALAGVDDEAVAEEYALTDVGLAPLREVFVQRLLGNPVLAGDEVGVRNMVSSKRENMLAALAMVREEFGGWEAYVRERCGLGEEEVGRLRGRLVGV
ncbi:hypothetical protein Q7P37_001827 [Cladosporium fusiforme]